MGERLWNALANCILIKNLIYGKLGGCPSVVVRSHADWEAEQRAYIASWGLGLTVSNGITGTQPFRWAGLQLGQTYQLLFRPGISLKDETCILFGRSALMISQQKIIFSICAPVRALVVMPLSYWKVSYFWLSALRMAVKIYIWELILVQPFIRISSLGFVRD